MKKPRLKGSGCLVKVGKYYHLRYMIRGQLKQISLECSTERKAKAKAAKLLNPIKEADTKEKIAVHIAEARNILKKAQVPITKCWELYLKNTSRPDSGPTTLGRYEQYFNKFANWTTKNHPNMNSLGQITEAIVQEYAEKIWEDGVSAKTFNAHFQALKLVFKVLARQYGISENPFNSIYKKTEIHVSRKEFTEDEVIKILGTFDDPNLKLMDKDEMKVLFHFGAWSGVRLGDCALMKWENINLERGIISCIPTKTKKTKRAVTIPIHPLLKKELVNALSWKDESGYILPNIAKRYQYNPSGIQKDTGKVIRFVGLETTQEVENTRRLKNASIYGFHSFRHSFVSFCAKGGVPLPIVQSIVGHGNPAMTRHYVHIGEESAKKAIASLPMSGNKKDKDNSPEGRIKKAVKWIDKTPEMSKECKAALKKILNPAKQA